MTTTDPQPATDLVEVVVHRVVNLTDGTAPTWT